MTNDKGAMQMSDKEKENTAIAQSDKEINCSSIRSKRINREQVQVLLMGSGKIKQHHFASRYGDHGDATIKFRQEHQRSFNDYARRRVAMKIFDNFPRDQAASEV